jgi:hypothetical protein
MSNLRWFSKKSDQTASPEREKRRGEATAMSEHEWAERHEEAIRMLERYIKPNTDGTLRLEIKNGESIGIDPVTFADLKRSLDETNRKIKRGEINPEEVLNNMR